MHLNQHGCFDLHLRGDVLLCQVKGDWNEVAVQRLRRDAAAAWQPLLSGRWGLLIDAREWGAATPEAVHDWEHGFEGDALAAGLSCLAAVLPSNFHRVMVRDQATRLAARCAHYQGLELEGAWDWLRAQGLSTG